jgi:epoxyqueuosine reductase
MGFALIGIARASEADHFDRYQEWLERGYAGKMDFLHRNAEPRRHPQSILEGVRSVIMLGLTYGETTASPSDAPRIAKYAQGPDYHPYLWEKLNSLGDWLAKEVPGTGFRGVTDSAPLLERDFARRAGLGWFGKNTLLIHKEIGSFILLSALLTTLDLQPDTPHHQSHCGTCTRCLDACPTQALTAPGWLDARRCISYLTIELKGSIPLELREPIGDWFFGCDICQDVCPWNRHGITQPGLPHRSDLLAIDPTQLLYMNPKELRTHFEGTSLRRANWRGLLRNAAIVLGNRLDPIALPALRRGKEWEDEVVREACEWAIERIEKGIEPRTK